LGNRNIQGSGQSAGWLCGERAKCGLALRGAVKIGTRSIKSGHNLLLQLTASLAGKFIA